MELRDAINQRRSIRGYQEASVSKEEIRQVLELAVRAVSGVNTIRQPSAGRTPKTVWIRASQMGFIGTGAGRLAKPCWEPWGSQGRIRKGAPGGANADSAFLTRQPLSSC